MITIIIYVLLCLVFIIGAFFVYYIYCIYTIDEKQATSGDNLLRNFNVKQSLEKDTNGYFFISQSINDFHDTNLIIDTQTTNFGKRETLAEAGAHNWDSFPAEANSTCGQKEKLPPYLLQSLSTGESTVKKLLVEGISKTNAIYNLLLNRKVIGKDILQHLMWKFSLDEEKLMLFSNNDQYLLKSEMEGYCHIEKGLADNGSCVMFPILADSAPFSFDLGYQGEICIDKKLFKLLSEKRTYKKYLKVLTADSVNTVYLFDNIDVEWKGIQIPNCTLRYCTATNKNLIGVQFMRQFNFILGYNDARDSCSEDLFIQPRSTLRDVLVNDSKPSDLGFDLGYLEGELRITSIKIGGHAEKGGVRLKDKVVEIDCGIVPLNKDSVDSGNIRAYLSKKKSIRLKIEREKKMQEYIINE